MELEQVFYFRLIETNHTAAVWMMDGALFVVCCESIDAVSSIASAYTLLLLLIRNHDLFTNQRKFISLNSNYATCSRIHGVNFDMRVHTPGRLASPHPMPQDTMPELLRTQER